jgi:hypothetical protein
VTDRRIPAMRVADTPTCTGFGTVSGVNVVSWRSGPYLFVEGRFVTGTCTATEARITIGFNGTSANVTSIAGLPTVQMSGHMHGGTTSATYFGANTILAEASKTYVVCGISSSGQSGLTKVNGNSFFDTNEYNFNFRVAITGWKG